MLLEFDLPGENAKEDPMLGVKTTAARKKMTKAKLKVLEDIEAAGAFLKNHEAAKIVVVIDTHCLEENGLLVWADANKAGQVGASTLEEVGATLVQCPHSSTDRNMSLQILVKSIPHTVYQYLSDSSNSPEHGHKSIVLNLACGQTIRSAEARSQIFDG